MTPEEPDFINSPSPGERLKAKRIEYGVSLQEVSSALLLSVTYLKALESNNYEDLPGLTYIVGYWRSYANLLGIDVSDEIRIHKSRLEATDANPAFDYNHQNDFYQKKSRKGSVILFLLLITGFIGGLWYWQNPTDNQTVPLNKIQFGAELNILNNVNNAADDVVDNSVLLPIEPQIIGQPDLFADVDETTAPGTGVDADADAVADVQLVDADNPGLTGTDTDGPEQDFGVGGDFDAVSVEEEFGIGPRYNANSLRWIKVDVHKTVWIDIRNGQGEKLVFRTVTEGENLRINGSPPFYVFIGSLDGVEVFYLGESVEIPPHSSGKSSRFVVGEYPEATPN